MSKTALFNRLLLSWLRPKAIEREPHQKCATCAHFADHSNPEDDPNEVNGYCCHPNHRHKSSPHYEYGGHWTHSESWCQLWEKDHHFGRRNNVLNKQMHFSASRKNVTDTFQQLIHTIESLPEGDLREDTRNAIVKVLYATHKVIDFELELRCRP